MSPSLEDLLTGCARESLRIGHTGPAVHALNHTIAGDPQLQDEARETIARDNQVKERDHLSQWRLSLLTGALADG